MNLDRPDFKSRERAKDAGPLIVVVLLAIVATVSVWVITTREIAFPASWFSGIGTARSVSRAPASDAPAGTETPAPSAQRATAPKSAAAQSGAARNSSSAQAQAGANAHGSTRPQTRSDVRQTPTPQPGRAAAGTAARRVEPGARSDPPAAEWVLTDSPEAPDPATYSASDAEVVPPGVVFPQQLGRLPKGTRREDLTTIEVIVNPDGTVGSVKAVEDPQSLADALVVTSSLSAVKSWRFRPALKNGRPVRYRQLISVAR